MDTREPGAMILGVKPICALLALLAVSACHHEQEAKGPFERAGAGLDRATDKTGHALGKAATVTGTAAEKAGRATGNAFETVGDKLGAKGSNSGGNQPAAPSDKKPE